MNTMEYPVTTRNWRGASFSSDWRVLDSLCPTTPLSANWLALIALAGLLSACTKSKPGPVAVLTLAPGTALIGVSESQALTATAADAKGTTLEPQSVAWTTSDPVVATVSNSGVVTGRKPGGPVTIRAAIGNLHADASVRVLDLAITSPLKRTSINPRYFSDATGRAIYLTGAHTWEDFQDAFPDEHQRAFDWIRYLDFLKRHNLNFTELWRWEQAKWVAGFDVPMVYTPMPYLRTGPGTALDGKPKFDLAKFDSAYFGRMRQRTIDAQQRGIYVSIMLFDGWSIETKGLRHGNPWRGHPFNRFNNVNGIDGDPDNDGQGLETHTLRIPAVSQLQDAYVRRVIDAVGDLDNVLYEISNESTGGKESVAWQNHVIAVIREYEAGRPKQHPVGMTALWPDGNDSDLFASAADFVSPASKGGVADTPPATGDKVLVWDTDHLCGNCGDGPWVWRSFTRGTNPVFMDVYDGAYPVPQLPKPSDPRWEDARRNMGYTLQYARRMNLIAMKPHPELASTGYCLANPVSRGAEYLVYLNGAHSATVNLAATAGALRVEWFDPSVDRATNGGRISAGRRVRLEAPEGAAVLYLY